MDGAPNQPTPRLSVHGLRVALPDGRVLIEDFSLDVNPGEVVVLLGGSGAGKSTVARVLFEPEELAREGFSVVTEQFILDRDDLGLVPQRGALFDHLDVRGNLDLALRYSRDPSAAEHGPREWLERVGMSPELAAPGTAVSRLSGGQAQRVSVARVLAGKRQLLFLDEPSVGLDPHRVRMLARLVREQVEQLGIAAIVVTHDVALAADLADQIHLLDTNSRRLERLFADEWTGPAAQAGVSAEERGQWIMRLEQALVDHIEQGEAAAEMRTVDGHGPRPLAWAGRLAAPLLAPFGVAGSALYHAPAQLVRRPRDFFTVSRRVFVQSLLRPLPFYAIVSVLIGYTVLYVISKVGGAGVRPDALIRQIGGSYVVALAPALSAVLFVAASGNATNAWLGSMGLTKQVLAMEALGIDRRRYLWGPAWVSLGLAYICVASLFCLGMVLGGLLVCSQYDLHGGWDLLTADLLDPRPERIRYAIRAAALIWIYAWGIAADVVAKGGATKSEADAVTRGMTSSVVACTLWMVTWELFTVVLVFNL